MIEKYTLQNISSQWTDMTTINILAQILQLHDNCDIFNGENANENFHYLFCKNIEHWLEPFHLYDTIFIF